VRWYAVHHDLATHGKWIATGPTQRGAWVTLVTIAAGNDPRGRVGDRHTATALLARDGFTDADALVDDLVRLGWLDELDGELWAHDFLEWQLRTRRPSDYPEETRKRKQEQRKKEAKKETGEEIRGEERRSHDTSRDVTRDTPPPEPLNPCPRCGAPVRFIEESKRGPFYGCSEFSNTGCPWKSNDPPKLRGRWEPSPADLAVIEGATPLLRKAAGE
jgi:hypothetical protein